MEGFYGVGWMSAKKMSEKLICKAHLQTIESLQIPEPPPHTTHDIGSSPRPPTLIFAPLVSRICRMAAPPFPGIVHSTFSSPKLEAQHQAEQLQRHQKHVASGQVRPEPGPTR